jgi:hypothetical protein
MIKYSDIQFVRTYFEFVFSNKTIDQINSSHMLVVFTNDGRTVNLDVFASSFVTSVNFCYWLFSENVDFICTSLLSLQSLVLTSPSSMFVNCSYELPRNSVFIAFSSYKEQFGYLFRRTVPTMWNPF